MPRERIYDYPPTPYSRALLKLGWNQVQSARILGIGPRSSRRYASGDREIPHYLELLLKSLIYLAEKDAKTVYQAKTNAENWLGDVSEIKHWWYLGDKPKP